jgi:rhodanese-related sulfurtransferase
MTTYRELLQHVKSEIAEITAPEAKHLVGDGTLFVDIRERDEWEEGNIPGAVHIPRGNLESRIEAAATDRGQRIVVYCQSGARASETAGVLEQLGFRNVKIYDASWLGYGNRLDAPAANATVFNVGAMNATISALKARIDALEKELAATKKP